jgi:preprotein translocase subunit SecD
MSDHEVLEERIRSELRRMPMEVRAPHPAPPAVLTRARRGIAAGVVAVVVAAVILFFFAVGYALGRILL